MSRPIFLSYRRSDSASATGRLYDAIGRRFGTETVYMDSSSTAWGERWRHALEHAVTGAYVVIVVIGPDWLRASDEWGRRRLDDSDDWVRREIELALSVGKPILPLLVAGSSMPPREALPPQLAELSERHAFPIDAASWGYQLQAVLDQLASHIEESGVTDEPQEAQPASQIEEGGVTDELRQQQAIQEQFCSTASRFYDETVEGRMEAAEEIAGIGNLLPLEDVLEFGRSGAGAERVAAAIAIAAHLRMSEQPRDDPRVQSTLRALLNDTRHSRVRYRAAEVLAGFPALAPAYREDLTWLAENDGNAYVRRMARKALRPGR